MRAALIAVTVLLVAGCANELAEREAFLNTLVGHSEDDLVRTIGVPSRTFEVNGHRFLAYTESRVDVIPGSPGPGPWGWGWGWGGGYGAGFLPVVVNRVCETTFEIFEGKVASYTLRGNACG